MANERSFSKRKYAEALRCLKLICKVSSHPVAIRLRAAEMILQIYGLEPPTTKRDKMAIRDLVQQHTFEKQLTAQVDDRIAQEDAEKLAQEQAQAEAEEVAHTSAVFDALLCGDGDIE
jgi:hypothetical protein